MNTSVSTTAYLGGGLIGLSVVLFALFNGRVLGVSGILSGALERHARERAWGLAFIGGLISGGLLLLAFYPQAFAVSPNRSLVATVGAGLLVGFGSRLGNGCTSGHGICGVSRLSPRSIAATLIFIATGMLTVIAINTWFGGAL